MGTFGWVAYNFPLFTTCTIVIVHYGGEPSFLHFGGMSVIYIPQLVICPSCIRGTTGGNLGPMNVFVIRCCYGICPACVFD